jgi:hypothetical protein
VEHLAKPERGNWGKATTDGQDKSQWPIKFDPRLIKPPIGLKWTQAAGWGDRARSQPAQLPQGQSVIPGNEDRVF